MRKILILIAAGANLLAGCAAPLPATEPADAAPVVQACPTGVPPATRCYGGRDARGAFYAIAIPQDWNHGVLVVHVHGGPDLAPANAERAAADLRRWSIVPRAGYAWVGSSFRRGGYGWIEAGDDADRSREIFLKHFGPARRVLLHGQSYGGGVAAKLAEKFSTDSRPPYDGVMLTNGMLGGGLRYLEFRFDLRVVYQYVCKNHPRPDELQYPLWMGLPASSTMKLADLVARINECTGVRLPESQRSEQQKARLADILNVTRIREDYLVRHLEQSTWLFRDLMQRQLAGRNPFSNAGVVYRGSSNDAALNAGVARYTADAQAVAALARDSDPHGKLAMPVLTMHAIDDPTAFVELESAFHEVLASVGNDRLVQVFTDEHEHSYLSDPEYPAVLTALLEWIDTGEKPTVEKVLALCRAGEAHFGRGCHIQPDYRPAPLESRVAPRPR